MPVTLKSRIPQIALSLEPRVQAAMRVGAEGIVQEAKVRVPVETGNLRDAIHVEKAEAGWSVVAGNTTAFYGHIVENGSVLSAPHPFLVPAAESQKEAVAAAVTAALRRL